MNLSQLKLFFTGFLASFFLVISLAFIPTQQDAGLQAAIFENDVITTTTQSAIVACNQGSGHIGRKTLVVWNDPGSDGAVTVTAELRDSQASPNFTTGYLAVNELAEDTVGADTAVATDAGGRFCEITAVSASTSTITVTLRRE